MAEKEYIERGAVVEIVSGYGLANGSTLGRHSGIADVINERVQAIPAADVAPVVHGEWIPVDEESPCDEWDCTACGQRRTFLCEMDMDDMRECYPYCPNCGARMDGGKA